MTCSVFVYGSLKRGYKNHARVVPPYLHIQNATTAGRLYDLDRGYPMMVAAGDVDGPPDRVHGELITFQDATCLTPLDQLEGVTGEGDHSDLYIRIQQPVVTEKREMVDAWVYVRPDSLQARNMIAQGTHLPEGIWHGEHARLSESEGL